MYIIHYMICFIILYIFLHLWFIYLIVFMVHFASCYIILSSFFAQSLLPVHPGAVRARVHQLHLPASAQPSHLAVAGGDDAGGQLHGALLFAVAEGDPGAGGQNHGLHQRFLTGNEDNHD